MNFEIKYVHTNIVSRDWGKLAGFYEKVFGCTKVYPERDLKGEWIEKGTGVNNAHINGIHLRLPGYGDAGTTLEIFQYNYDIKQEKKRTHQVELHNTSLTKQDSFAEEKLHDVHEGKRLLMAQGLWYMSHKGTDCTEIRASKIARSVMFFKGFDFIAVFYYY
ncbi:MAG: hypothetical protein JXB50_15640 [Spirochaetes bacterium]|nr:hypothetical protein [Spirochaetota bacterium]